MSTDLPEVVVVPVEHRISIVYAKHDKVDVRSRETALSETGEPLGRSVADGSSCRSKPPDPDGGKRVTHPFETTAITWYGVWYGDEQDHHHAS